MKWVSAPGCINIADHGKRKIKESTMKRYTLIIMIAVLSVLTLIVGCAPSVSVQTKQYLGVPLYPPTDPAGVAILREPPLRPNVRLGEIILEPQNNPPVTMMEQKLQQAAGQMGADAAVLVMDRTMSMGATVTGPWWGRQISPDYQRVIVAVAIKYTE